MLALESLNMGKKKQDKRPKDEDDDGFIADNKMFDSD